MKMRESDAGITGPPRIYSTANAAHPPRESGSDCVSVSQPHTASPPTPSETAGVEALDYVPGFDELSLDPMFTYMTALGGTIAGGSNEIMRNLIAERVLDMPRG